MNLVGQLETREFDFSFSNVHTSMQVSLFFGQPSTIKLKTKLQIYIYTHISIVPKDFALQIFKCIYITCFSKGLTQACVRHVWPHYIISPLVNSRPSPNLKRFTFFAIFFQEKIHVHILFIILFIVFKMYINIICKIFIYNIFFLKKT